MSSTRSPAEMQISSPILLIEDEVLIAMAMCDELVEAGFDVRCAYNFDDAQQMIANGKFQAAILDFDLKGRSSAPLAAALKRNGVPIVGCSGSATDGQEAAFAGLQVLAKPYSAADLVDAVQRAVATKD